jgi:hypothetical protein
VEEEAVEAVRAEVVVEAAEEVEVAAAAADNRP